MEEAKEVQKKSLLVEAQLDAAEQGTNTRGNHHSGILDRVTLQTHDAEKSWEKGKKKR